MAGRLLLATLLLTASATAWAAPVTVQVVGADGAPLAGSVVEVVEPGVPAAAPRGAYVMNQQDISFAPHVLVVPVGATVRFANSDKVRHHVYSFSAPKRFDLKLFGRQEDRTVTFDKPGAVALGCNIHDRMSGVVYVSASPYVAVTGADGRAALEAAPARATLAIWHPAIRARDNRLRQPALIPATGYAATVRLAR